MLIPVHSAIWRLNTVNRNELLASHYLPSHFEASSRAERLFRRREGSRAVRHGRSLSPLVKTRAFGMTQSSVQISPSDEKADNLGAPVLSFPPGEPA